MKKPLSVRLEENYLKKLSEICEEEKVSRSVLINKAVGQFLQNYGKRVPELSGISGRVSELEKGYRSLTNRVNILNTRFEKMIKRKV
jgi:metal-responsive CopG/Arc/MetJ family transcriptional regulator